MNDTVLLNISIESSSEKIWQVLTNADTFNKCFENIKIQNKNLEVGNSIIFESVQYGKKIVDEAIIKTVYINERLSYAYKKQNSKNEIDVTFSLKPSGDFTYLTIEGRNFLDDFERSHSENIWINMMQEIKKYLK